MPYYVYVIELDKEVLNNRRFRKANPNYDSSKPCVYVGQSANEPKIRFNQHLSGYKSSRFPREFGIRLRPNKFEKHNPISSRDEAEAKEEWLAKNLRKKGYGVWSN